MWLFVQQLLTKKISKLYITCPLWEQPTNHWWFSSQRASNVESVAITWPSSWVPHVHFYGEKIDSNESFQIIPQIWSRTCTCILKPLRKDVKIKRIYIYIFTKQTNILFKVKSKSVTAYIRFPLIPMQLPPHNQTLPLSCHKPCYKAYLIPHKGT